MKGSSVPAKIFNSEDCVCIHKCHTKLSMEERRKIFDDFYALGNFNLQSAFIFGLVKVTNKLRTYTAQISNRRQFSRIYFLPSGNGGDVKVCKDFF